MDMGVKDESDPLAELRKLSDNWLEIEKRLVGTPVKDPTCYLSVERYHGKMRLCYKGKPVTECSTSERISAALDFKYFLEIVNRDRTARDKAAKAANQVLEEFLNGDRST